jgi:hypothetical protein
MKKLILFLLLITSPCFAFGPAIQAVVSGGQAATANGSIGTTVTGTGRVPLSNAYVYFDDWTPSSAGTVRYGHFYVTDSNGKGNCISLHSADGTAIASCSSTPPDNTAMWANCDLGSDVTISALTTYYIGIACDAASSCGSVSEGARAGNTDYRYNSGLSYACPPTNALTLPGTARATTTDLTYTVIFNNTSGNP